MLRCRQEAFEVIASSKPDQSLFAGTTARAAVGAHALKWSARCSQVQPGSHALAGLLGYLVALWLLLLCASQVSRLVNRRKPAAGW